MLLFLSSLWHTQGRISGCQWSLECLSTFHGEPIDTTKKFKGKLTHFYELYILQTNLINILGYSATKAKMIRRENIRLPWQAVISHQIDRIWSECFTLQQKAIKPNLFLLRLNVIPHQVNVRIFCPSRLVRPQTRPTVCPHTYRLKMKGEESTRDGRIF